MHKIHFKIKSPKRTTFTSYQMPFFIITFPPFLLLNPVFNDLISMPTTAPNRKCWKRKWYCYHCKRGAGCCLFRLTASCENTSLPQSQVALTYFTVLHFKLTFKRLLVPESCWVALKIRSSASCRWLRLVPEHLLLTSLTLTALPWKEWTVPGFLQLCRTWNKLPAQRSWNKQSVHVKISPSAQL